MKIFFKRLRKINRNFFTLLASARILKQLKRWIKGGSLAVFMLFITARPAFALENAGQRAGQWAVGQLFWLALAGLVVGLVFLVAKRNWVAFGITAVIGGFAIFIIDDPTRLSTIGQSLWNIFMG